MSVAPADRIKKRPTLYRCKECGVWSLSPSPPSVEHAKGCPSSVLGSLPEVIGDVEWTACYHAINSTNGQFDNFGLQFGKHKHGVSYRVFNRLWQVIAGDPPIFPQPLLHRIALEGLEEAEAKETITDLGRAELAALRDDSEFATRLRWWVTDSRYKPPEELGPAYVASMLNDLASRDGAPPPPKEQLLINAESVREVLDAMASETPESKVRHFMETGRRWA